MIFQFSTAVRNARLDAIESTIGTAAKLRVYSGSMPANCAASATGTMLVEFALASDWAAAASGGAKALSSLPLSAAAAAGAPTNATYWRLYDTGVVNCGAQGDVSDAVGTGSLKLSSGVAITSGQHVDVASWTITDGNP